MTGAAAGRGTPATGACTTSVRVGTNFGGTRGGEVAISTPFQHQVMPGDGIAARGVLLPTQSSMPPILLIDGTHHLDQTQETLETRRHLAVQIQKHFMVRNLAQLTGQHDRGSGNLVFIRIGKAMGNKVLR